MILIDDLMAIFEQTNRLLQLPTLVRLAVMPSTRAAVMPSTRAAVKSSTRAAVKPSTRAAVKPSTRTRVEASTRAARGDKGRRQRDEEPPTIEAALELPRLDELCICNEKRERQVVLKEKDW
jgi:hypothetical protein